MDAREAYDMLDGALADVRDVMDSLEEVGDGGAVHSYIENAARSLEYALESLQRHI